MLSCAKIFARNLPTTTRPGNRGVSVFAGVLVVMMFPSSNDDIVFNVVKIFGVSVLCAAGG